MFTFKQFTIDDSACAMKVGTDGVLLGAWAPVDKAHYALDIGTGSGLIALMLAQRNSELTIDAIDIDEDSINQATKNIINSPFAQQVKAHVGDILNMQTQSLYELIVSNPPFYQEQTACPNEKRDMARHTAGLPFDLLIQKAKEMLAPNGLFCVIIPTDAVATFIGYAAQNKLYLQHKTDIFTTPRKAPKRTLLCFTPLINTESSFDKLYMRNENNEFSQEYKKLTEDFYL